MHENKVLNELIKHYHENKLAHAFLIETNDCQRCYSNILQFLKVINCPSEFKEDCKECNLCHLIESENLPSLVKIEPDGTSIKKEQVIELKNLFKTKPTFSKYNMYVILNAEALNASSANTLLKFIEEPEEHIIGFFITNNKENIIDTIKSRCQILFDSYENQEYQQVPKVWRSIAINYIKEFESVKDETLLYNKDVLMPLIHERKELLYLFQSMLSIYHELYQAESSKQNLSEDLENLNFVLKKGRIYLSKQLNLILKILDELNYNLNISLVLDKFVLEGSNL